MPGRPPTPYPDGDPTDWDAEILEQGQRGAGKVSHLSNGDFKFHSAAWKTLHGPATVGRMDEGAHVVWGALLPDGRRVFCRRSSGNHIWRRRSDDGRSWVLGEIRLEPSDVLFTDGIAYLPPIPLDGNSFERAMAERPNFIRELQDDSFAHTFNQEVCDKGVCTLDGEAGWCPARGEAAATIAKLRGFWETYIDFKYSARPDFPLTDLTIVREALHAAGWRFAATEECSRFSAG